MEDDILAGCDNLSKIYIPNSVSSLSDETFGFYVDFEGTIYYAGALSAFKDLTSLHVDTAKLITKHKHNYKETITKATMSKDGKVYYSCACGRKKSSKTYQVDTLKLSKTDYIYDGKTKTPKVTVTDTKGNILTENVDYKVIYASGRKKIGNYKAKVELQGKYEGSKYLKFSVHNKTKALKLSVTDCVIAINHSVKLTGTATPSNASQTFSFSSSNKSVASVDTKGNITAKKVGNAIISVKTVDGVIKKCSVKVINAKLNTSKKTINVNQKYTLKVNNDAYKVSKWSSSNTKVAIVDTNGIVKGLSSGTATITAKLKNGACIKSKITVKKASLIKTTSVLKYESKQLILKNAAGSVKWSSSNTNVAKISSSGVVKGVSKGTVTITATCGGVKYTCKLTVKHQDPVVVDKIDWDINFLDGVEPSITLRNNTSKDVKYIDIYTYYRNRFGDPAYCDIWDSDNRVLTVESGLDAKSTKTFYWDAVIYNANVSRIDITDIIVTYVDGSTQTIFSNVSWCDSNYYYQ